MQHDRGDPPGRGGPRGGQLPPEVYWRRRAAVAAAALVAAALLAWAVTAVGGSTAGAAKPPPGRGPAAAAPRTPAAQSMRPSPRPTVTVTATATPTVTVTATPRREGKPCRDVGVRIVADTNKKAYGVKAKPVLEVRVTSKKRCVLDPDKLELMVTSGTDQIWSSSDCPGLDRWPRRVERGYPYRVELPWPRERSNPAKCDADTKNAEPGWYVFHAELGGQRSGEAVFRLR